MGPDLGLSQVFQAWDAQKEATWHTALLASKTSIFQYPKEPYMAKAFTRPGIKACIGRGVSFSSDGLISFHGADFLHDERFTQAYECGIARHGFRPHIEWRVRVALWAATHAMKLAGDFVECGVNTGILTGTVLEYVRWNEYCGKRKFYLLDTFKGIPVEGLSDQDRALAQENVWEYTDIYDVANEHFANYLNVILVRGRIPETLEHVRSEHIAYLSIDMNVIPPEIAAGEFFWSRLVPGALIVLDDYNYVGFERLRNAWDSFAARHDIDILPLPTGQGLIIKPPV
jgi:hypothetical protein